MADDDGGRRVRAGARSTKVPGLAMNSCLKAVIRLTTIIDAGELVAAICQKI